MYYVIYDGNCNLCVNFVKALEAFDRGQLFNYVPMQDEALLQDLDVQASDCEKGMLLIQTAGTQLRQPEQPEQLGQSECQSQVIQEVIQRRWQGSDAAEEIGRLLPAGKTFVELYRSVPGVKWMGDRLYEQVRDNRYAWFGRRDSTYQSAFPVCHADTGAGCSKIPD